MISISQTAQDYFLRLLAQQDEDGLGLRMRVLNAGTPQADCELMFCANGERQERDRLEEFSGFNLFLDADSIAWLDQASIDFEPSETGGQLTITAPNIKGRAPGLKDPIEDRVAWIIDTEINPAVAAHGGRVTLHEVTDLREVVLQFGGGCHGCGMVNHTLKNGVEKTLKAKIPEITAVVDITDHATGSDPYYAPGES